MRWRCSAARVAAFPITVWYARALAIHSRFSHGTRSALMSASSSYCSSCGGKSAGSFRIGAAVVVVTIVVAALLAFTRAILAAKLSHRIFIPRTVAHPNGDASYRARANEWHVTQQTFKAHPILGVGPGYAFT
jgi:O-antigen ligase